MGHKSKKDRTLLENAKQETNRQTNVYLPFCFNGSKGNFPIRISNE